MGYEDPQSMPARLRLGREEFAQRLLTSLILGGPYPRWNTRNTPSTAGVAFLLALDALSFGQPSEPAEVFVDELDLPRRHEDERGGAPDQAVLWDDRVWLIELKTEPGSYRRDQLPSYFDLGAHHFPAARVDITYLTPQMSVAAPDIVAPNRYAHVTWDAVADIVDLVWGRSSLADERSVSAMLLRVIATLGTPASAWREAVVEDGHRATAGASPPTPPPSETAATTSDTLDAAVAAARLTRDDGRQRAVNLEQSSLEALQDLRLHVRRRLFAEPARLGAPPRDALAVDRGQQRWHGAHHQRCRDRVRTPPIAVQAPSLLTQRQGAVHGMSGRLRCGLVPDDQGSFRGRRLRTWPSPPSSGGSRTWPVESVAPNRLASLRHAERVRGGRRRRGAPPPGRGVAFPGAG